MALTFVSTCPSVRLGPGMAPSVGRPQSRGLYSSVDLGRADRRVPQQLLDRAQVGATVEQVRRERVAQGMRRDAALDGRVARPDAQTAAHVGGRQPPAG